MLATDAIRLLTKGFTVDEIREMQKEEKEQRKEPALAPEPQTKTVPAPQPEPAPQPAPAPEASKSPVETKTGENDKNIDDDFKKRLEALENENKELKDQLSKAVEKNLTTDLSGKQDTRSSYEKARDSIKDFLV